MYGRDIPLASRCLVLFAAAASLIAASGCGTTPSGSPLAPSGFSTVGVTSTPMLGYAWDATSTGLRPIYGVPGAARFGAPQYSGAGYTAAAVCAAKNYALLTTAKGAASLAQLPSGTPVPLAAQLSAKTQVALSPGCTTALLYAPGTSAAFLITGLPAAPQPQSIELSSSGSLTSAIVSDSGLVLAAFQSTGGVAIEAVSPKGSTLITTATRLAGMTFLGAASTNQNALIADAAKNTIWLASGLAAAPSLEAIATAEQGISQPSALAASADGRWLLVANKSGASILRIDLTGQNGANQSATQTACNCTATKLSPLTGNSTFLLSDLNTGPVWTFDGDSSSPRIVFIPAVRSTAAVASSSVRAVTK
jgi:hypothetical protein